ncbi:hypothetical protein ANME2D_02592 [Candidatus Methanoperedens nitroreducens]|uniref:DUF2073 domain-containing protein n=1 Tax=Candidatus Methanoperedens nitratireducens TaxID=1392998 RepID=A0A062UU61_9EURY|nr:DUF2073 domain-containing protein [Candidatus Methanoperedens nitroreducens]KCZ70571.1 hypothetical protein ANME2D_02592 [Candidatus Methanoperedens nitroreducens]MDJ1420424.1 DUF2073 domain-containing protein [Candidatus Methanoperedens sp.]
MNGIQLDLISEDKLDGMTSMEKVRLILDSVRNGRILVLERGLTPSEQTKLIELTMTEIAQDDFSGIEIESYPVKQSDNFLNKLLGKNSLKTRLTVIGPATQLKTIKKDRDLISALVSTP